MTCFDILTDTRVLLLFLSWRESIAQTDVVEDGLKECFLTAWRRPHGLQIYQLICSRRSQLYPRISSQIHISHLTSPAGKFSTIALRHFWRPNSMHRFHVSLPTARLSSQALVCLNTYTSSTKGPDGGKEGSAMGEAEELAKRAWTRLGTRGENQAIVFL